MTENLDWPVVAAWTGIAILGIQFVGVVFWVIYDNRRQKKTTNGTGFRLQAEIRAEALLRELLTPEQYCQLHEKGYLGVASPSRLGRIYRISRTRGMVNVYEHGVSVMSLCLQPVDWLPTADVVLMHVLMIKGCEEEYLKKANQFEPGYPYYLRWNGQTEQPPAYNTA